MNILVVGSDSKGAWHMRGLQLGQAIGARVTTSPERWDWDWAELVVLVKRAAIRWQEEARRVKVPVVWDVLDFWAQPQDNSQPREAMIAKVKAIQEAAGVSVLIGATRAMAEDIGGVYLPHHCRLGMGPGPIRDRAEVVAYEGTPKYLGRWKAELGRSCLELGLRFVVNPPDIRDADVLVSFRDGKWDGWVCREWKSGVKHVNAIVAGRPMVSQTSAAGKELDVRGVVVLRSEDLTDSLRVAALPEMRRAAHEHSLNAASSYQLPAVARDYAAILRQSARLAA